MGIVLDGFASALAIRILAIDRPGCGATSMCPVEERVDRATQQTISLLEALGGAGANESPTDMHILAHSAGWLYALSLVAAAPHLFRNKSTRVLLSSPFVPTHLSGNLALAMLPASLVRLTPKVAPTLGNALQWSSSLWRDALSWSRGMAPSFSAEDAESTKAGAKRREEQIQEASRKKHPGARFHPPYETHFDLALDANLASETLHPGTGQRLRSGQRLLFDYLHAEKCHKGVTQDFLLCLGKVRGMSSSETEQWIEEKLAKLSMLCHDDKCELDVIILWNHDDCIIPHKGRAYLNALFEKHARGADKFHFRTWTMAETGHDDPVSSRQVMKDIADFLCPKREEMLVET